MTLEHFPMTVVAAWGVAGNLDSAGFPSTLRVSTSTYQPFRRVPQSWTSHFQV